LRSLDMRVLELNAEYLGVSGIQLMENAGAAVAAVVREATRPGSRILVACGVGNNGGDGMVAARHLAGDYQVTVVLIGSEEALRTPEARHNWRILKSMPLSLKLIMDPLGGALKSALDGADVVVDAIFGTGLKGEVGEPYRTAINLINSSRALKVAVDTPSGLNPDTGEVHGVAVKADVTVTFHAAKPGFQSAAEYVGRLVVKPIGFPPEAGLICGPGDVHVSTRRREPWSKKGDHGRILVIGGSSEYAGAPALAALASLRMGADIAVVYAPREPSAAIRSYSPSLIVVPYDGEHLWVGAIDAALQLAEKSDVVVLGPGLGLREETVEAVRVIISKLSGRKPLVVDADGLKALAGHLELVRGGPNVLTPHAGELAILTGVRPGTALEDRARAAMQLAREAGCTVLLKGHVDVVTDGERVKFNGTGNPGMTVGGTGDVLTGVVAVFLAWTLDPFRAASSAAFINGLAGDLAALEAGPHLTPVDVIQKIPEAHALALDPARCRERRPPLPDWSPF